MNLASCGRVDAGAVSVEPRVVRIERRGS